MSKIIKFVEALPLVRLLQVAAIILFISGLVTFGEMCYQLLFRGPVGHTTESIINDIQIIIMFLGQLLFQPLVLLALAEIIKGQAQQTNLHD
jgi:hypothetical protein